MLKGLFRLKRRDNRTEDNAKSSRRWEVRSPVLIALAKSVQRIKDGNLDDTLLIERLYNGLKHTAYLQYDASLASLAHSLADELANKQYDTISEHCSDLIRLIGEELKRL